MHAEVTPDEREPAPSPTEQTDGRIKKWVTSTKLPRTEGRIVVGFKLRVWLITSFCSVKIKPDFLEIDKILDQI
jgi:hypothetical protein